MERGDPVPGFPARRPHGLRHAALAVSGVVSAHAARAELRYVSGLVRPVKLGDRGFFVAPVRAGESVDGAVLVVFDHKGKEIARRAAP